MNRLFLLDTNIISEIARNPAGAAADRLARLGHEDVFTSIIVLGEIDYGLARNPSTRTRRQMLELMGSIEVRDMPRPAADHYANLRVTVERRGTPTGANDLWIAAHALVEGAILVTGDMCEFSRVDGLEIQNWLEMP